MKKYKNCSFLREDLSDHYKQTGSLGMPFGVWDPQYIPVGVFGIDRE